MKKDQRDFHNFQCLNNKPSAKSRVCFDGACEKYIPGLYFMLSVDPTLDLTVFTTTGSSKWLSLI